MLELKNISFQVPDEKTRNTKEIGILKDVSLTLEDNQFVVITGPNGGGKSTLAKIIAGIEKPTSGQILFDGQDITDMSITDRAKLGISYAFQQPVRFKGVTVFDLLPFIYDLQPYHRMALHLPFPEAPAEPLPLFLFLQVFRLRSE